MEKMHPFIDKHCVYFLEPRFMMFIYFIHHHKIHLGSSVQENSELGHSVQC